MGKIIDYIKNNNIKIAITLFIIILIIILVIKIKIYNENEKYFINNYVEYNLYNGRKWGPKESSDAYRFGDVFSGYIFDNLNKDNEPHYLRDIEKNYPDSFASRYVKYCGFPKSFEKYNYDILTKIFEEYNYDKPDNETLVVHLRLGDVLDSSNPDYSKYYYDINHYHDLLEKIKNNKNIKKVDIVTGLHKPFFVKASNDRLNRIRNIFEKQYPVNVIITNHPDKDLYYMSHSKYFVKSGSMGGYTNIISNYVKRNNNVVY